MRPPPTWCRAPPVGRQANVRAVAAGEQPPIDAPRVVALPVWPVLGELRGDAARAGQCAPGAPPGTARRAGQRTPRTASRSAPYGPMAMLRLEAAPRRGDLLQQVLDCPFGRHAFALGGEVAEHAMPQHRTRHAPQVVWRHVHTTGSNAWASAPVSAPVRRAVRPSGRGGRTGRWLRERRDVARANVAGVAQCRVGGPTLRTASCRRAR